MKIMQISFKERELHLFDSSMSPVLLYAGTVAKEPSWGFPMHQHEELCEIIYISSGAGRFVIGNHTYEAKAGDVLIYNGGVLHEEHSDPERPLLTYFCGIGRLKIKTLPAHCLIAPNQCPVIPTGDCGRLIENHIRTLFEELQQQEYGFETVCRNALISLIVTVRRLIGIQCEEATSAGTDSSLGRRIKAYIDSHFTHDISLNEIASRLYISPYYLSHIFKEETGDSPINYLIRRRIGEAKRLLLTTERSVGEIAEAVGYVNVNYFSTQFKKVTGHSPTETRKSQPSKPSEAPLPASLT